MGVNELLEFNGEVDAGVDPEFTQIALTDASEHVGMRPDLFGNKTRISEIVVDPLPGNRNRVSYRLDTAANIGGATRTMTEEMYAGVGRKSLTVEQRTTPDPETEVSTGKTDILSIGSTGLLLEVHPDPENNLPGYLIQQGPQGIAVFDEVHQSGVEIALGKEAYGLRALAVSRHEKPLDDLKAMVQGKEQSLTLLQEIVNNTPGVSEDDKKLMGEVFITSKTTGMDTDEVLTVKFNQMLERLSITILNNRALKK